MNLKDGVSMRCQVEDIKGNFFKLKYIETKTRIRRYWCNYGVVESIRVKNKK